MKKLYFLALVGAVCMSCGHKAISLSSPDNQIQVIIHPTTLSYQLLYAGDTITDEATLSLTLENGDKWDGGSVYHKRTQSHEGVVHPVIGKNAAIADNYNELRLQYGAYDVIFRAYNEGFAYRFVAYGREVDSITIVTEQAEFPVRKDPKIIFGETNNLTAWELSNKVYEHVSDIDSGHYAITPTVLLRDTSLTLVIAEADLHLYPGMYVQKSDKGLVGYWARSPKKIVMGSWGNFVTVVAEREDNLATVPGNHAFPWRVIIPTKDDKSLLNNELIYLLAASCKIDDTSWIKAGKASWEWWHCFEPRTTELYKYYIDFSAENNLEYMLVDAGWNNLFRPTELNPKVDMHEVLRYGQEKGVGVWLWMAASTLMHEPHHYLDTLAAWGAVGLKIDFFDRDDDEVMYWYDELARAAAERKLLIDFHGCSKPTGLNRTYPNVLNFEAVRGQECNKWDTSTSPDYRMQFIYGRGLAGPMDYTPGAMRNCYPEQFKPIDPGMPFGQGTRSQELALYVLLDDYFAMLADSPADYRAEPTILQFLSDVPVVWDKTVPLDGRVGRKAVVAKQSGDTWYVGGMCSWTPETVTVAFDFLEKGRRYSMQVYRDKMEDTKDASQYIYEEKTITADDKMTVEMARGGGFVMVIK